MVTTRLTMNCRSCEKNHQNHFTDSDSNLNDDSSPSHQQRQQQQHDRQGRLYKTYPRNEATGELVTHIDGLEYYPNWLSVQEQIELLELVDSQPWQSGVIARRQQFYGEIYYHTTFKSKLLQPATSTTASSDNRQQETDDDSTSTVTATTTTTTTSQGIPLVESGMMRWLQQTKPFFEPDELPTQVLVNEYLNNMGISSHFEDFDAFGPVILTVSLINPTYMTLKRPVEKTNSCEVYHDVCKVVLEPGSLLVMKHDARNLYRHGIGKAKWIKVFDDEGSVVTRVCRDNTYRRISLTVRHLLKTRRRVHEEEDEHETKKDPTVY
jgi:alkylated DNA repair dioxygenase AlkB